MSKKRIDTADHAAFMESLGRAAAERGYVPPMAAMDTYLNSNANTLKKRSSNPNSNGDDASSSSSELRAGDEIAVHGLVSTEGIKLNGRRGIIIDTILCGKERDRIGVRLLPDGKKVAVKVRNLRVPERKQTPKPETN